MPKPKTKPKPKPKTKTKTNTILTEFTYDSIARVNAWEKTLATE